MKAHLKTLGIAFTYIHAPGNMHANLPATLPASNGASQPGIVMSGRMDMLPVDGRKWDTSLFVAAEKDGKLYDRRMCDMNGFLDVCTTLPSAFTNSECAKWARFVFSYGEGVGCVDVPVIMVQLKLESFEAGGCLVGNGGFHAERVRRLQGIRRVGREGTWQRDPLGDGVVRRELQLHCFNRANHHRSP